MSRAYTVVYQNPPHLGVGSTFVSEEQAYDSIKDSPNREIWEVVTLIDDFTSVDYGVFMFRTDGIHEVSYVVAEETSDLIDTSNEAAVSTKIVDPQ